MRKDWLLYLTVLALALTIGFFIGVWFDPSQPVTKNPGYSILISAVAGGLIGYLVMMALSEKEKRRDAARHQEYVKNLVAFYNGTIDTLMVKSGGRPITRAEFERMLGEDINNES